MKNFAILKNIRLFVLMKVKVAMSGGGGILLKMFFFIPLQRFFAPHFQFYCYDVTIYILMNRYSKKKLHRH